MEKKTEQVSSLVGRTLGFIEHQAYHTETQDLIYYGGWNLETYSISTPPSSST